MGTNFPLYKQLNRNTFLQVRFNLMLFKRGDSLSGLNPSTFQALGE